MKNAMFALCAMVLCGVAVAGEPASVLNHGQSSPAPAPAAAPAPVAAAPATVVTGGPTLLVVESAPRNPCANGSCRLYSVDEKTYETKRRRLFGGSVVRNGSRTVVRPVR